MRARLYLETTIPSYLVGRPSRDLLAAAHQEITREWWASRRSELDLYASELVVQEVRAGDAHLANQRLEILRGVPILAVSDEILKLAEDQLSSVAWYPLVAGCLAFAESSLGGGMDTIRHLTLF